MARTSFAKAALAAVALLGAACSESKTPTEPSLVAATPTPLPTPSTTPGPPASIFGTVDYHGGMDANATIGCQGRSTSTSAGGSFVLGGLTSGTTVVTIQYFPGDYPEPFQVLLNPGTNEFDFVCGLPGCNR